MSEIPAIQHSIIRMSERFTFSFAIMKARSTEKIVRQAPLVAIALPGGIMLSKNQVNIDIIELSIQIIQSGNFENYH